MRTRSRLLITGLATLLGLAGGEVFVRHLDRRRTPATEEDPLPIQNASDPRLRFENRPGARMRQRYFDLDGHPVREVVATINALGFRGPLVESAKPAGVFRIVVIGDSQSFGSGVAEEESWPAVLAKTVTPLVAGARIEVMNCAVPGYDAEQSALALESRWLAYSPDLVLLGYFVNDPALPGIRPSPRLGPSRWLMTIVRPGEGGAIGWLRRRSALVDFVLDGAYRRLRVREWALGGGALHEADNEGWVRTQAAIMRERDLCAAAGARFGLVLLPFLVPWNDGLISTGPYAKVSQFCAATEIPSLDLEPFFAGRNLDGLLVHERDPHSGSRAHFIEGEAVAGWILDRGLVPKSLR